MMLSGGSQFLFISSKLSANEFYRITEDRYNDNIHLQDSPNSRRPTVDIDVNEITFKYLNTAIYLAGSIFGIAKLFSSLGIDVMLVGDPVTFRYDTKQVTTERAAKRERACLHCINIQDKINQMLKDNNFNSHMEVKDLEKYTKNTKNASSRQLPSDFCDVLHSLVKNHVPELHVQGTIKFIIDDKFQAGVVVSARVTGTLNDMIVSSDTDYAAYLGKDCTCLKDFKYNSSTNTISEFILYSKNEIETYRWSLVLCYR